MKRFFGLPWAAVAVVAVFLALFGVTQSFGGGASPASAASVSQQIGMKILLITDNTNEPSYQDWENTLNREGVPFDSVVTTPASGEPTPGGASTFSALPALSSTAPDGTQVANYEGVVVAISGTVGMTTAQWTTLQTYEHQFSVRQLIAYGSPSSDFGMNGVTGGVTLPLSTGLTLTADGSNVFPYLKQLTVDPTQSTFAYESTPVAGANVDTLVSGPGGSTLLGIYTSSDGRQTMFQTFNENQYYLQSQLLRHGELDWVTRNTYFGDQRNYLETDVDDNFLSDDIWDTATHSTDFTPADAAREVPADVVAAANWSKTNNFRIDMLFNGGGSVAFAAGCTVAVGGDSGSGGSSTGCNPSAPGTDPLLAQFQAPDPANGNKPYTDDFGWISHTWDHPNIDQGCATQNYIEAELNQNTNWGSTKVSTSGNPNTGGLGLTSSTSSADTLGTENPNVIITGEHSGIANLLPGNPGQVDPPALDTATPATTGGTLAAGDYVYAVTDQFNSAAPGATPVPGTGQSAASVSAPVTVTGTTGSVALTWGAVCHAAQYTVYRAPYTAPVAPATTGTIGAWSLLGTVTANTSTDFTNPSSTTNTSGGGAVQKTFTDTGLAGAATGSSGEPTATTVPSDEGAAVESPYEQNPVLDAAFAGTLDGGIKYFGSDASKPYPNPADGSFATGSYAGAEYPAGSTFQDAGGTAIPRYPTNIYYNVATNAQEIDEYTTLYDSPPGTGQTGTGQCKDIAGVTTCYPYNTTWTIDQIVASIDQGMFQHMMGNDPRPHYFHQTNLMSQSGQGDGLFYETVNPLLAQYNTYFASNAPIEQLTMPQIGTLLTEQAGWATANKSQISGYIEGNVVTVDNNGTATEIPLTGTTIGTPYAGTQSGWTSAPTGTSTYTALAAWPALPTTPVIVTPPTGPAPGGPPASGGKPINQTPPSPPVAPTPAKAPLYYVAVQVGPKTVSIKNGKAIVSLKCQAKNGKPAKNHFCTGKFTLKLMGKTVSHTFRIKATKVARIAVTLPKRAMAAATTGKHRTLHGALAISTKQPTGAAKLTRGTLNIKT
jgi:hypothetical protein